MKKPSKELESNEKDNNLDNWRQLEEEICKDSNEDGEVQIEMTKKGEEKNNFQKEINIIAGNQKELEEIMNESEESLELPDALGGTESSDDKTDYNNSMYTDGGTRMTVKQVRLEKKKKLIELATKKELQKKRMQRPDYSENFIYELNCENLANFYQRSKKELVDFWDIF